MSPTLTTFLFEAANFLLLAAALGWLFFKPVRHSILERRARLETESRLAEEKLAAAAQKLREADHSRAHLQDELNDLRARELQAARDQADQLLAQARQTADHELQQARQRAGEVSKLQHDLLAQAAATAAAATVGRLLEQLADETLQAALIRAACAELRSLPAGTVTPIKIESAVPLSRQERAELEQALGSAVQTANFQVVEELVAGVRIATAKGLIDASVLGLTNFARQSLTAGIRHGTNNHPSSTDDA